MAATQTPSIKKGFVASKELRPYRLVKLGTTQGQVTTANDTAGTVVIGATDRFAVFTGNDVSVSLLNSGGSAYIEAGGNIDDGAAVYAHNFGKVVMAADATNNVFVGYAVKGTQSFNGNEEIIEVLFA